MSRGDETQMRKVDETVKYIKLKYVRENLLDIKDNRISNPNTNEIEFPFIKSQENYSDPISLRLHFVKSNKNDIRSIILYFGDKDNKNDVNERDPKCEECFDNLCEKVKVYLERKFPKKSLRRSEKGSQISCITILEFKKFIDVVMDLHIQKLNST